MLQLSLVGALCRSKVPFATLNLLVNSRGRFDDQPEGNQCALFFCHSTKMGRKNRHSNKNRRLQRLFIQNPRQPTAAVRARLFHLFNTEKKYGLLLKIEQNYRYCDTFSDDPAEDVSIRNVFGNVHMMEVEGACSDRAIQYFERARATIESESNADDKFQALVSSSIPAIAMKLAGLYSDGRDLEKAISSHRWLLENCKRDQVPIEYLHTLCSNFRLLERWSFVIEVLGEFVHKPGTFQEKEQNECAFLITEAYMECKEYLKAKIMIDKVRPIIREFWTVYNSGLVEEKLCNHKAAIDHFRNAFHHEEFQHYFGGNNIEFYLGFGTSLLRRSADNEAEAFQVFQEGVNRCEESSHNRCRLLSKMGAEYRNLKKWNLSIEVLHQLCLFASRVETCTSNATVTYFAATKELTLTYLEQYCTDTTLDIDERRAILHHATAYSIRIYGIFSDDQLIHAQLCYFNGDIQTAYQHLEHYLDNCLVQCKLGCSTCEQRVRHKSVARTCESCRVASYCDRRHQKMTWKKERICHKVLCPLIGYWRMAKKAEKKGRENKDLSEKERVFERFYENICPHAKLFHA